MTTEWETPSSPEGHGGFQGRLVRPTHAAQASTKAPTPRLPSRTTASDEKAAVNLTRQCALVFLQPLLDAVGLADSDLGKRRPFSLTVRFHFNVTGTDAT